MKALRQVGASVQSLADIGHGCPDLLVGFQRHNYLFEIKNPDMPPSKRKLTNEEFDWRIKWNGHSEVVEYPEQALKIIGAMK